MCWWLVVLLVVGVALCLFVLVAFCYCVVCCLLVLLGLARLLFMLLRCDFGGCDCLRFLLFCLLRFVLFCLAFVLCCIVWVF